MTLNDLSRESGSLDTICVGIDERRRECEPFRLAMEAVEDADAQLKAEAEAQEEEEE